MLNLNELAVFLAAAECGNFSEAGRKLHLSQPAVSQNMENLEKRFGAKLFARQGRSVRLTEAGQVLKPLARELLAAARRLDETMASLQGEVVGEMNIGCSTASGKYLLPGLIARFRRSFPQVRINMLVNSREAVLDKLLSGEFTLGISSKRVENHDLEYQDFFSDEVILIVPAGHAWTRSKKIFPDDLLEEPLILREDSAGTRQVVFDGLLQHDISPDMLKVAMVLGNAEAIEMAVEEGIGVAFLSRLAARRGLECGSVVEIKVEGMPLSRMLYLARNRRFPSSRAQAEFWSFVGSKESGLDRLCTPSPLS
jgi:DNA-binding transcriptional LysR family regulator